MKTLHFVRHAQSAGNAGLPTTDNVTIPLTDAGLAQAQQLAGALELAAPQVLASNYLRARQTAQPYCSKIARPCEVHPLLHEFVVLDPVAAAGTTNVQRAPMVQAYWDAADPALRMGPGAETFGELSARVAAVEAELHDCAGDSVIFGHGLWFALLIWRSLGFKQIDSQGMKNFRAFQLAMPMPNCAVYQLHQASAGRWRVVADENL
jgi:broad specificity phosphatase PhoE